jgi:hypothetical protein
VVRQALLPLTIVTIDIYFLDWFSLKVCLIRAAITPRQLRPILVDVNVIPLDSPTSPVHFGRDYDSDTQKVLVAQNKEVN